MTTTNDWADFWYYKIGANVIPADTKNKKTTIQWGQYQTQPIPEDQHQAWKNSNAFDKGIAIISGKLFRGENEGKYLIFIDCDNQKAIDEFVGAVKAPSLQTVSEKWIVEQHKDAPEKAHIYVVSPIPFPKKSSDAADPRFGQEDLPAIEIKGEGKHGIAYCTPSLHKNGHRYQIIGTKHIQPLAKEQAEELLERLGELCKRYGIKYLEGGNVAARTPATDLFSTDFKVYEGSNRHEALLRAMDSIIKRNAKIATEETQKLIAMDWNRNHCVPPLPDGEFEKQWKSATKFMAKHVEDIEDPVEAATTIKRWIGKDDKDSIITVEGRLHSIDQIRQTTILNKWDCLGCGREYDEKIDVCKSRAEDHPPNKKVVRRLTSETMIDQRFFEIILFRTEDRNESLDEESRFWCNLTGDKVHTPLVLGQDYRITGQVEATENQGKSPIKGMPIFQMYLEAENVIPIDNKEEKIILTDEDRKAAKDFAESMGENLVASLVDSLAPHIYGQDLVKESILYQIVGAQYDGNPNRPDIHVLIIGDPSEGKTEMALAAEKIAAGEFASGESVSKVGIGAGLVKDDNIGRWVIQGGIAVLGNKRLKCLDEIDKMPREYLNELLTIMDKGFFKLDKVKHARFETKGAWLCTGNPKGGKYNSNKSLWMNIDFPIPVLTRFDLIYILKKTYDPEQTKKKLGRINNLYTGVNMATNPEESVQKYLLVAKECKKITIEPEVFTLFEEFYQKLEIIGKDSDSIPITERQYHGLLRIAIARAKLHLRDRVTASDAKRAIEIMTAMMFMAGVQVQTSIPNMGNMAGNAETHKDRVKTLNSILKQLNVGKTDLESVKEDDIVRKMLEHSCWSGQDDARSYLRTQQMEGSIWQPRAGYWSVA